MNKLVSGSGFFHWFSIGMLIISLGVSPAILRGHEDVGFVEAVRNAPVDMRNLPQNQSTRQLLARYKPRIFVSPNSYLPISFYRDYLPKTVLRDREGKIIESDVPPSTLEKFHDKPGHYLDYQLTTDEALKLRREEVTPTLYGRVYADTLTLNNKSIPLLFLKYSPVFPYSGLPYGNAFWKNVGAWLAGNPWGWHQLDIHGAIHVILHGETRKPLGVLFGQHNHHKTRLRGEDFSWPKNGRIRVSYSVRSNEPYLISDGLGSRFEPTIGNPSDIEALYGRTWFRPLSAGYDKIVAPSDGAKKISTKLKLLSHDDPLNTAVMKLGDRRKLFGLWNTWFRQGPPGIDYYAHPALKNLADLAAFWYIDPSDDRFFNLLEQHPANDFHSDYGPVLSYQKRRLLEELRSKTD